MFQVSEVKFSPPKDIPMILLIVHLCGLLITFLAVCTLNYKSAAEKKAELQEVAWPSG